MGSKKGKLASVNSNTTKGIWKLGEGKRKNTKGQKKWEHCSFQSLGKLGLKIGAALRSKGVGFYRGMAGSIASCSSVCPWNISLAGRAKWEGMRPNGWAASGEGRGERGRESRRRQFTIKGTNGKRDPARKEEKNLAGRSEDYLAGAKDTAYLRHRENQV